MSIKKKYSICMVNLNMSRYIEAAVISILNQIDEQFEVVVVDGGSKDNSVKLLKRIQKFYPDLKIVELKRDLNRRLGEDRNHSIKCAQGEYVLLHLDCDDLYMGKILEWVKGFHMIEKVVGHDCLVAGKHINMGKKELLLEHGPYRNLHFEDRELWNRLDALGKYIELNHADFVIRMKLAYAEKVKKFISKTYYEVQENFAFGSDSICEYLYKEIISMKSRKVRHAFLRTLIIPIAISSRAFKSRLLEKGPAEAVYKRSPPKTLLEILSANNNKVSEAEVKFIRSSIFNV